MHDQIEGELTPDVSQTGPGQLTPAPGAETPPKVRELLHLPRLDLTRLWQELFRRPPAKSMSAPLMLRFLAFELQARDRGGLPDGFVAALTRQVGTDPQRPKSVSARLRPGGRLLREWNGTTYVVDITDTGFLWRGQTWTSLSAIA